MKVVVVSANLGHYDPQVPWVTQVVPDGVAVTVHRLTDQTWPTREKAMTPRLQSGIAKMHGWELFPGADVYLWVDASRGLLRPDTVAWFLAQLGSRAFLVFQHPERRTIREEYEFVKARMQRPGETYLTSRYRGEWLDDQYRAVTPPWYQDTHLFASTAFAYRPTLDVKAALKDWFYHKARYLLHDQLAMPYVLADHRVTPVVLQDSVYACEHLPITRGRGRARWT